MVKNRRSPWAFIFALLLAWTLTAVVVVQDADAHYTGAERHSTVGLERAKKVARITHEVWTADWRAHAWQGRISCESGFRKWVKGGAGGNYWGLAAMGPSARQHTGWSWPMDEQLEAAKEWEKEYDGTWSCPLS